LEVWQKSIGLAELVYRLSAKFPPEEKFGLTSQVRRAAASVAANIAEGSEREGTREFLQFLGIANGSIAKTETLLILAARLGLAPEAEINAEAWATLNSDTSRPFEKPKSGRIAVKVINHLGDEVMKVFKV